MERSNKSYVNDLAQDRCNTIADALGLMVWVNDIAKYWSNSIDDTLQRYTMSYAHFSVTPAVC